MMAIMGEMPAGQEVYSIDKCFLDVTGIDNLIPFETFGQQMRERIHKETGLFIGVGFAPTKTLAKLANHAAKKWTQTGCVVDLSNIDRQRKLMALVPVEDVWGVGRRINKKLNAMGITTAKDVAEQSTWIIRKHISTLYLNIPSGSCAASHAYNSKNSHP